MHAFCFKRLVLWLAVGSLSAGTSLRAPAVELPSFQEVYNLARSNLAGVTEADLGAAALEGLLQRFAGHLVLETNGAGAAATAPRPSGPPISQAKVFDDAYGYLRVAHVGAGLPPAMDEALAKITATNRLKGLVVDLRYAGGNDYACAAAAADRFLTEAGPLLDWGEGAARSTSKTNAFSQPVVVLVNAATTGAAEALAAVLRETKVGLVIGAPTAGRAAIFKEFALSGGQRLRLATAQVRLVEGKAFPAKGLTPDISVVVNPDDEKQYYADAYKLLAKPVSQAVGGRGATNVAAATNRAARITEADLVRMKREGIDLDPETGAPLPRPSAPGKPAVSDPALVRALDLLKGLAVVRAGQGS
jgi:hypothetical protein